MTVGSRWTPIAIRLVGSSCRMAPHRPHRRKLPEPLGGDRFPRLDRPDVRLEPEEAGDDGFCRGASGAALSIGRPPLRDPIAASSDRLDRLTPDGTGRGAMEPP